MSRTHYRGFDLWQSPDGVWHAIRFGVTVCNGTLEGLKLVIDTHIADRETWFKGRAEYGD